MKNWWQTLGFKVKPDYWPEVREAYEKLKASGRATKKVEQAYKKAHTMFNL